ncbi:CHKB kinase, partial [Nyctiprogne leucopyga]|nr:CHKB kinase [Nyctiprogne leucopyga]
MFAVLAERALGPRLFGIFPQGRLEQYVPVRRGPPGRGGWDPPGAWGLGSPPGHGGCDSQPRHGGYLEQISELTFTQPQQLQKFNHLKTYNLQEEMRSLRDLLESTPSPVVFCHNDVQEGNILLLAGQEAPSSDRLMLIDFEYSSYNYRGFDIGNHFCEWGYSYTHPSWPFFLASPENFPSREQQLHFIRHYLWEQSGRGGDTGQEEQTRIEEEMLIEVNR